MYTSPEARKLIEGFEGLELVAYQDLAGVWTIGYGHTGPEVHQGQSVTPDEADRLMAGDLRRAENGVNMWCARQLNQHQFDALVSLTYNVGVDALRHSTLLERIHDGNYIAAAAQFPKWDKAKGKEVAGLLKRRIAERDWFLTHTTTTPEVASRG